MDNIVFIDEKWFYMMKKSTNYYLLPDEDEPHRTCKSKNFISKVMFLAAVARPRFDSEGNETFSGKIEIFPFVNEQPAKRSSANRVAGTLENKLIASVTREVNKMFLINHVLPAIKNVWPKEDEGNIILIQQDNAKSHVDKDDEDFFKQQMKYLQHKESTKTVDDLIKAVEKSFDEFSIKQSDKIFMTLQSCMVEIMKAKGSNKYKIPHMKKDAMYNQGRLPSQLSCDLSFIQEVTQYLENVNAS
ncbi:uncharacterized protein LOC131633000 [Vicia villosa]|uniref:uncharacterized protein LOC131633000 n=1 Tax=Vicia villosa TaxID=3911 RepID=UPI00273CC12A|nr:uncharacterized protein LOC131633000 [Vicia villosa]